MEPQSAAQQDQEVFSQFHTYPWRTDLAFLKGLIALLGDVEKLHPDPTHGDLALHARIFYYRKVRQVQVDFSAYKLWVDGAGGNSAQMPDQDLLTALYWAHGRVAAVQGPPPPNPVHAVATFAQKYASRPPEAGVASQDPQPGPAWQQSAPKLDLRVDRNAAGGGDSGDAAPYPNHFAELIAAVRANKPVPGVREIPDTVVRDAGVKPVGKMTAPKKPWEVNIVDSSQLGQAILKDSEVQQEFPPLKQGEEPESSALATRLIIPR
ncbi:hypothetical protein RB593_009474 [Gaeumannomyces tritici]